MDGWMSERDFFPCCHVGLYPEAGKGLSPSIIWYHHHRRRRRHTNIWEKKWRFVTSKTNEDKTFRTFICEQFHFFPLLPCPLFGESWAWNPMHFSVFGFMIHKGGNENDSTVLSMLMSMSTKKEGEQNKKMKGNFEFDSLTGNEIVRLGLILVFPSRFPNKVRRIRRQLKQPSASSRFFMDGMKVPRYDM